MITEQLEVQKYYQYNNISETFLKFILQWLEDLTFVTATYDTPTIHFHLKFHSVIYTGGS